MAADREVIQEFLTGLGFEIDQVSAKKFSDYLIGTTKTAGKVTAAIAGVVVAAEAMVGAFARGMERMHYASKRTKASVGNLQSIQFAFSQIGLDADQALSTVEAFAANLRNQPGLTALLENLGVEVGNRDRVKVLHDTIKALSRFPHYIGAQFAEQFGISEEVFLQYIQDIEKVEESERRRSEMNRRLGVDADAAAKASARYAQISRDLWTQLDVLTDKVAIRLLPIFEKVNEVAGKAVEYFSVWSGQGFPIDLSKWGEWGNQIGRIGDQLRTVFFMLKGLWDMLQDESVANWANTLWHILKSQGESVLKFFMNLTEGVLALFTADFSGAKKKLMDAGRNIIDLVTGRKIFSNESKFGGPDDVHHFHRPSSAGAAPSPQPSSGSPQAFLNNLERSWGLPSGILDRMWATESGRGRNMLGPMTKYGQAKGHFQFLDSTAKDMGLKNPFDFQESAEAAAKYMNMLLKRYSGDLERALAAYNWGLGNTDASNWRSRLPRETQKYIGMAEGLTVSPTTNIYVTGTGAQSIAEAIASAQRGVNSNLVRNLKSNLN